MATTHAKAKHVEADQATDYVDESAEPMENGSDIGNVQIHNNVIATIARLAALKVPGVAEMSGGLVDGLAGMIGKKNMDRGIRVDFQDNSVLLELHVMVEYGVRIPHVAWQIQNEVRQAVEQMTGKPVKTIQVIVQGVKLPSDKRPDKEAQSS